VRPIQHFLAAAVLLPLLAATPRALAEEAAGADPAGIRRLDALTRADVIPFFDQVSLPRWDQPGVAMRNVDLGAWLDEIASRAGTVEQGARIQEAVSYAREAIRDGRLEGVAADNGVDNPFLGFRYMESAGGKALLCAPEPFFEKAESDRALFLSSLVFAVRYAHLQAAGPSLVVSAGGRSVADEYLNWMDAVLRQALYLRDGEGLKAAGGETVASYLVYTLAEDGLEGYSRLVLGLRQDLAHETVRYYRMSTSTEDLVAYLDALSTGLSSFNAMLEGGALSSTDADLRFQVLVVANTYLSIVPCVLYDVSARHPLAVEGDPLVAPVRVLVDRLIRLRDLAHPRTSELLPMLEFVLAKFSK